MEDVTVTLLVPRDLELADRWRIPVSEWEVDTGATCDVREYDAETGLTDAMGQHALIVCRLSTVPQLHRDVGLVPIPADLSTGWQEVFDGLRKTVGSPGREPTVLPLSASPLLCFYRTDLLEQAGLSPPATWADYRRLVETAGDWAPGHTVVEPWDEESRATMFLQRSAGYALHPDNFSFVLNVSTGEPLIDQPPFIRALEEIRADFTHLDPASLSMDPQACCLQVLQGNAAIGIGTMPLKDNTSDSEMRFKVGVSRLPAAKEVFHSQEHSWSDATDRGGNSVTVVSGDSLVVCAIGDPDDESRRYAWELWNGIDTLDGTQDSSRVSFRRNCRASDYSASASFRSAGLDSDGQDEYIAAATSSLQSSRVVAELPFPERARFRELLTQRLTEVLEGDRPPAEAFQDLARDWGQILEASDRTSVLNTHRWCLGLSPLPSN